MKSHSSSVSSSEGYYDSNGCYTKKVSVDCKGRNPTLPFNPLFHICWGYRKLPNVINYIAGPSVITDPVACAFWPTAQVAGTMTRGTLDGYSACYAFWSGQTADGFRIVFNSTLNNWPISPTIDRSEMNTEFGIGVDMPGNISYLNPSGYCSQAAKPTGQVTMSFSVTASIAGKCSCPITVWYQG